MKALIPLLLISTTALAQTPPPAKPAAPPPAAAPAAAPQPDANAPAPDAPPAPFTAQGGTVLMLRGLDKISGRPTDITAPIGKPVTFATLTITARYCYSTPPSEPPETAAFIQVTDHRPDQGEKAIFSGWMYASTPGLNGMQHPLYDVWAISCNNPGASGTPAVTAAVGSAKVAAPDSSDKEKEEALPAEAGR